MRRYGQVAELTVKSLSFKSGVLLAVVLAALLGGLSLGAYQVWRSAERDAALSYLESLQYCLDECTVQDLQSVQHEKQVAELLAHRRLAPAASRTIVESLIELKGCGLDAKPKEFWDSIQLQLELTSDDRLVLVEIELGQ